MAERRRIPRDDLARLAGSDPAGGSLLDVVDSLLEKGVALDGELVLGLADVDLIYVRLGALVAAADRVFEPTTERRRTAAPTPSALRTGVARPRPPARPHTADDARRGAAPPARGRASPVGRGRDRGIAASDLSETNKSVMRLVLTLVEFVRTLLERQAIRRVDEGTLTPDETERLGRALMLLEDTVQDLASRHGIDPSTLNLDLGPLGRLK